MRTLGLIYSPDEQGEYAPLNGAPRFSMQGLSDALADVGEGITEPPAEEYAMILEVMMADHPGWLHPPAFFWNVGMVIHILKSDPILRELEHVQVDGPGTAYLFFYDRQGCCGLSQYTTYVIWAHVEEAFSEWISCSTHFAISLLPLVEAWRWVVTASDHQWLRGQTENPAPMIPIMTAGESNSSVQLVGSTPQQTGRLTTVEEMADARTATRAGPACQHGQPPKSPVTIVSGGGSPPSSPDRGALDSDGYSTASKTTGHWHHCRGHRGSRVKKWLAPARLDMPVFKSTNPGAEVMYTLWHFDVDAFLKQYDEASMRPHIFASLCGYPAKWAHTFNEGKDISVKDLLMHMEKMFGNKCDYDAMIRTLYEVQQKEDKTVEEYMLRIHDVVVVIHRTYPERLPDHGRNLKKDRFYHGLWPYLHDALSFAVAELPKREQARPTFDTLYTLEKKLEAGQPVRACCYTPSSDTYREKHRHYPAPTGRAAALEEEGMALANPTSGEESESEVEAVDGINVCLAQVTSRYQREERKCFMCGSTGHFAKDCLHHNAFKRWHHEQLNAKGVGENNLPTRNLEPMT